jgi:hypothetical protein
MNDAYVRELEKTLVWYATTLEQTKMPHSAGDMARLSLNADLGKKARKALATLEPKVEPWEDRMGGQFTEEEIRRSERGGDGW